MCDGYEISVGNKRLEILAVLLENAGNLVSKEQIFDRVWPDQIVEDSNLTLHVHNLRRLLGDNPKKPSFILTVPGVGYMLVGSVKVIDPEFHSKSGIGSAPNAIDQLQDTDGEKTLSATGASAGDGGSGSFVSGWLYAYRYRLRIVLMFGLLCLVIGLWAGHRIRVQDQQFKKPTRFSQLTTLPGIESYPEFSPDGGRLVFTSEDPTTENVDIYVKEIALGNPLRLTSDPKPDIKPVWSPDGRNIALLRKDGYGKSTWQLIVIPSTGGEERMVGDVAGGLDWSPDGKNLLVSNYAGDVKQTFLFLVPIEGGEMLQLTFPVKGDFIRDSEPIFSPNGQSVAFLRNKSQDTAFSEIHILDLSTRSIRQLTFALSRITDIEWNKQNNEIIYASNRDGQRRLWRIAVDGGSPVAIESINAEVERISVSPDGSIMAYTQAMVDTNIDLYSMSGGYKNSPLCRINSSRADDSPRFSPDGRQLAFISNRSGWDEIWTTEIDCRQPRQLTNFQEVGVGSPRWSPDREMIVYDRREAGKPEINLVSLVDLTSRRLMIAPRADEMPSWSFDNRWIYFESNRMGELQIWRASIDGGELHQVTHSGGSEAVEADQGQLLIYTNEGYLWQKDLRTGVEMPIPELKDVPIGRYWDVVGSKIYFVAQTLGVDPFIKVLNLKSRQIKSVFPINGYLVRWLPGISISPDEKYVAVSFVNYRSGDVTLVRGWR